MTTIVLRGVKNAPLLATEVDANFTNLNTDKAEINSPTFTGIPLAPTASSVTSTTQLATTAYVKGQNYLVYADTITTSVNLSGGTANATNVSYSGTLTGSTGVIAIGTDQIYKDISGNVGIGIASSIPSKLAVAGAITITGAFALRGSYGAGAITSNFAAGDGALASNTTGSGNTASGVNALQSNTTGNDNTASGTNALQSNTTGVQNFASGVSALYSNTTGNNNTAIGVQALQSNTTGVQNTASGVNALLGNTTGYNNTASGVSALLNNTTGNYNTASGVSALHNNTTGYNNTAIGANTLLSNTTGYENTAVGTSALNSNIDTYHNVAIGVAALMTSSSDLFNTAIGTGSLKFHDGGDRNTGCGTATLFNHLTGNANTAVGCDALYTATSGDSNTAVGDYALYYNISGSANTAVGRNSGRSITTGSNNVIIGGYNGSAAPISATGSNFIVLSDGAGAVRQTLNVSGALSFGLAGTAFGTAGQVLQSNGDAAVPTWVTPASGIGVGQTWQNMTGVGGRASGVTMYNTTGNPIVVCVLSSASQQNIIGSVVVNGITIKTYQYAFTTAANQQAVDFIVPANSSYMVTITAGGISTWLELR